MSVCLSVCLSVSARSSAVLACLARQPMSPTSPARKLESFRTALRLLKFWATRRYVAAKPSLP